LPKIFILTEKKIVLLTNENGPRKLTNLLTNEVLLPSQVELDNYQPVQMMEFLVADDNYKSVSIAGSFNDWSVSENPMKLNGNQWTATLKMAPGTYQYQFVIDKEHWVLDPNNSSSIENGYGTLNSLLEIPKIQGKSKVSVKGFEISLGGLEGLFLKVEN